ncbi:hypothetical protein [Leptolyngbya sp. NIES-2104]|uniref:hypothetical protein n=1 Tax=Leptolyngbya sp. NIES-2104 TaxID=1552121 RepID=UPI0006EC9890|nr:hypothetical protein [Leptolyngbya sp. NIES-2104]GAP94065.1 hypothetical protein NIES2104_05750 [Leptolyngbya sp. NIES-2104]
MLKGAFLRIAHQAEVLGGRTIDRAAPLEVQTVLALRIDRQVAVVLVALGEDVREDEQGI